jgi:GT2 family glycosyltransferase
MGALISMAVYSTAENKKDECLAKTLASLKRTVDFTKHRLILSVNGFTDETCIILGYYESIISKIIWNETNLGTAEAINLVWKERKPGEHCIKSDDDVVINSNHDWIGLMEEVIAADKHIGQVGLKRKDLIENPNHPDPFYRSEIITMNLPSGQFEIEKCNHIMGTCVMHSSELIEQVGYLWQFDKYGFDDSLMSLRANLAGFKTVFLPCVDIDHIDEGQTPYQTWKEGEAMIYLKQNEGVSKYTELVNAYRMGKDVYYNPFQ